MLDKLYIKNAGIIYYSQACQSWWPITEFKALLNQAKQRASKLQEMRNIFESDFLNSELFFKAESLRPISITKKIFEHEKNVFVKNWIKSNALAINKENSLPDSEQLTAIGAVSGHIQVVARAGSGKTTTLVYRTFFLLKHCQVKPNEILILAFNRKAAFEVRKRLLTLIDQNAEVAISTEKERRLRDAEKCKRPNLQEIEEQSVETVINALKVVLPHVMTFHALAYAIVHPEESILFDGADGDTQGLSRVVQQVIDDHIRNPAFHKEIRSLMLAHFRSDWESISEGRYDQCRDDFLEFRRSLTKQSLNGDFVKSWGEKLIADFLFEHDVPYKYERNHFWNGVNYRPDFTVFLTPKTGLIIEYFGLTGDPDYDDMSDKKRAYWQEKTGWTLLEFTPQDFANGNAVNFQSLLKSQLEVHGVTCRRLSEDEIWYRIRDRAIDSFTTAIRGFIARCRKLPISPDELQTKIGAYSSSPFNGGRSATLANKLANAFLSAFSARDFK